MQIELYTLENGQSPIEDFLDSLDAKVYAKVSRSLFLLQEYGPLSREPLSKHLDDGIFELRIQQSKNAVRILYFFMLDEKIILTNGFFKKTRKTPRKELAIAKKYRDDYLKRRSENENL